MVITIKVLIKQIPSVYFSFATCRKRRRRTLQCWGKFDIQAMKANQKNLLLGPTLEWITGSYKKSGETG
jgi:hypothetical protein